MTSYFIKKDQLFKSEYISIIVLSISSLYIQNICF